MPACGAYIHTMVVVGVAPAEAAMEGVAREGREVAVRVAVG